MTIIAIYQNTRQEGSPNDNKLLALERQFPEMVALNEKHLIVTRFSAYTKDLKKPCLLGATFITPLFTGVMQLGAYRGPTTDAS